MLASRKLSKFITNNNSYNLLFPSLTIDAFQTNQFTPILSHAIFNCILEVEFLRQKPR